MPQGSTQGHWRFPANRVEAGHAYILTHPGTPAIFWDHWRDAKLRPIIERLVALRRDQGIHCRSTIEIHECVPCCRFRKYRVLLMPLELRHTPGGYCDVTFAGGERYHCAMVFRALCGAARAIMACEVSKKH